MKWDKKRVTIDASTIFIRFTFMTVMHFFLSQHISIFSNFYVILSYDNRCLIDVEMKAQQKTKCIFYYHLLFWIHSKLSPLCHRFSKHLCGRVPKWDITKKMCHAVTNEYFQTSCIPNNFCFALKWSNAT